MRGPGLMVALGVLLSGGAQPAAAQETTTVPDSASAQIRTVLRAFYLDLANQNWDALAAFVLSPKLLERRGTPGDLPMVTRDRNRSRGTPPAAAPPRSCPSSESPMIDGSAIRLDGDWAEVSVPRCSGASPGVDEFGMLYFEHRWRFIYIDLFQPPPTAQTAER